ncbi:hypothetical protein ABW21_db0202102 [Orbilia brochopaga]|nr:hypothetical protein ABW21_db0202102 [Drechslerella brochopaga]
MILFHDTIAEPPYQKKKKSIAKEKKRKEDQNNIRKSRDTQAHHHHKRGQHYILSTRYQYKWCPGSRSMRGAIAARPPMLILWLSRASRNFPLAHTCFLWPAGRALGFWT